MSEHLLNIIENCLKTIDKKDAQIDRVKAAKQKIKNEKPYMGCLSKEWVMSVLDEAINEESG